MAWHMGGQEIRYSRDLVAIPNSILATVVNVRERKSGIPLLKASQAAQNWIGNCLNMHEHCQKNIQPESYPTRLLELGESTIRLVLSVEETLSGPYAALSYCWGPNPTFYRLKASNFHELQLGIFYTELPKAFQEAIEFIKSLSIKYLWIDSLCVIQSGPGSTEDWLSECSKMQAVYSNCILSLCLSRAANPSDSCLGNLTYDTTPPFQVEIVGFNELAESPSCIYTVISTSYYREALYNQPLESRAWALQERFLPPRVLSFGLGELFWDCIQTSNANESFPIGLGSISGSFDFGDGNDNYLNLAIKSIPQTSNLKELESIWWSILKEYTDRSLTYPGADKLAALSAVATRMGSMMKDVYIAGHFWRTLPYSLNWQVTQPPHCRANVLSNGRIPIRITGPLKNSNGKRQNKTPSWSWASMDGPLFVVPGLNRSWLADAETYTLISVDDTNPAGQVAFANLEIKAYCIEVRWTRDKLVILNRPSIWNVNDYDFLIDLDDKNGQLTDKMSYWVAVLAEHHWLDQLEGLILEKVEMDGGVSYRRRGHYVLYQKQPLFNESSVKSQFKVIFGQEKKTITLI